MRGPHALTPARFLAGLIAALSLRDVRRLTPGSHDRVGFQGLHTYLKSAVTHDADIGDDDFSREELHSLARDLAPGIALNQALAGQVGTTLHDEGIAGYRIALDEAAANRLLAGYDTQEMGFLAVAVYVFLRETALPA